MPECDRAVRAKGLCFSHYKRAFRPRSEKGSPDARRESLRRKSARRRAAERAPGAEKIELAVLAERDSWTCQLCKVTVDPVLKYPDPMSASKDHKIALGDGGEHTYANHQLLHLRCNWLKASSVSGPKQGRI